GTKTVNVNSISDGGVIENNRITGPLLGGVQIATPNILVQGNDISGPVWTNTDFTDAGNGGGAGIEIRNRALPTANITRNFVCNLPAARRIVNAPSFAAKIALNDFTDYDKEILVPPGYAITTELSVDPEGNVCGPNSSDCRGNYWGLSCELANGFDPTKVISPTSGVVQADGSINITGPVNASAQDSHPYGVPVSDLSD